MTGRLNDRRLFIMSESTNWQQKIASPLDFLKQVRVELAKVVWPSRQQTIKLTLIVIIVAMVVGFFILGVDFLLQQGLKLLTSFRQA